MRISRPAVVGVATIVLALAALGVARWKKRRADSASSTPATGILERARERAAAPKHDRAVYLDPLPLTARVDDRFKCGPDNTGGFFCGGAGWEEISWKLERDASTDSIDAIITRARPQQSAAEAAESGLTHEDAEVAGFRGFIDENYATRMPVTEVTFTGYRDDPHGRVKLTIYANGWRSADPAPGQNTDSADAVAIMLTTELAPKGLPPQLPDQQDLYTYAEASTGMGAFLEDAKPDGWVDGAARFAHAKSRATDPLREYFSRAAPVMVDHLGRRIGAHSPDATGTMLAARLAESLFELAPTEGARTADDLARATAAAWSPTQTDAGAWVEAELRLAALRMRASSDTGPGRELVVRLAPVDRNVVLRDPRTSLDLLSDKLHGAEATKLLEAWMEPAGVPGDADFGGLAAFAMGHLRAAAVRRHVLAMLSDKRHAGEVESRAHDVLFRGVSLHGYPATELPATKATRDFRVCDVYAGEAARDRSDLTFNAWATEGARDAQIAAVRQAIAHN
jgi:hypothetical protein